MTEPQGCCRWAASCSLLRAYHDEEWGRPEGDGRALWEKLVLDGFQAGLSWKTVLAKRPAFRRAFAGFQPPRVARFDEGDIERLLANASIIRSRAKIVATIDNARALLAMERAGETFADFVWDFVDGAPQIGDGLHIPTQSPTSVALSRALKARGFRFVGPTIVYAWMQAVGMVVDHERACHLWRPARRHFTP